MPVAPTTVAEKSSTAGAPGSQSSVGEAGKANVAGEDGCSSDMADETAGAAESKAP